LGIPGQNVIWMWASWRGIKYTTRGKVVPSPQDWAVVSLVSLNFPVIRPNTKSAQTMH
jgi:hypothetical protein